MPDLSFQVEAADMVPFATAPMLKFKLRVTNTPAQEAVQSIILRCQIQIEAARRRYNGHEPKGLYELFGEPERWSQTLKSMLWTFANTTVPPFAGSTVADVHVPCTSDFNVAAAKYFYALEAGEVPLTFLFSGTVFYEADDGTLQVTQVAWDKEALYRLPVRVWQEMMEHYYPNSAWLTLRKDVFDRLYQYKMRYGLTTWEQALERLLVEKEAQVQE